MTAPATVNVVDVVDGGIEVYADQITVGDALFDTFGGTHKVRKVEDRRPKSGRYIVTTRHDGWVDHFMPDDIVAILPDGSLGRSIDRASSGSRQHYIETGRYSTVDEEHEFNGADLRQANPYRAQDWCRCSEVEFEPDGQTCAHCGRLVMPAGGGV